MATIEKYLDTSISHGTLRDVDLIDSFSNVIANLDEDNRFVELLAEGRRFLEEISEGNVESEMQEAISYYINEDLFESLNDFAPDGYYFGAHPGDGSDFGFWKSEEYDEN